MQRIMETYPPNRLPRPVPVLDGPYCDEKAVYIAADIERTDPLAGEKGLWDAVLQQARDDLNRKPIMGASTLMACGWIFICRRIAQRRLISKSAVIWITGKWKETERDRDDARKWFLSNRFAVNSFLGICEALDLNADKIRQQLKIRSNPWVVLHRHPAAELASLAF